MDSDDRTGAFSGPFLDATVSSTTVFLTPGGREEIALAEGALPESLPQDPDCETAALLRMVVLPQIEGACSWPDLVSRLRSKGFGLGFRSGRMILSRLDSGAEVCTGRSLGAPLRALALRLGRPALRLSRDGRSAQLQG
ncbi:hypothetical protein [Alloyangia pacifica]|uniref:hypothetical protein n=1 Tax=Alloyangia pacifica TaxID=311180 RepID=UPI001CD449C2|nr:hypothetical protein [Alloyangia pacifica]MCA0997432.1 hypothetical protein [Alloyangia pacifica]